ncbi:MAG: Holliday junction DNA helicase RuvA [Candidatus Amoebophilus sp. 36-38]|nr:MAG: Holliday junction DNA helicase RuvA [Candidatus Amoebophilus sp. 36-38]
MARIVAIDYGLKRVGLAVTDPLQMIATPLITVPTPEVLAFLETYLQKEPVEAFVVGFPGDLKDRFAPIIIAIHQFIELLCKKFPAQQIFQQDERYTSKLALASLVEGGFKKKDRRNKANIDKLSATLILQSFLTSNKPNRI